MTTTLNDLVHAGERAAADGLREALVREAPATVFHQAAALRDQGTPGHVTYSRKVFIPLTRLCRDVCHYCTFAQPPKAVASAYLSRDQVLAIARAGEAAGCDEALLTLGDKPERRYAAARTALARMGHATTIDYLVETCRTLLDETTLLPHVNPGVLTRDDLVRLRDVSVSQGLMLESASRRLLEAGSCHHGSPDKEPERRLETLRLAGELRIPFTTGILIGIGETRAERLDALFAIRALHAAHGHIQEVIVQNFRAKPGTRMAGHPEPDIADLMWTIAAARLILGSDMIVQAPPNLSGDAYAALIDAGLNDWGGISPVTPDHVNPEAAWPHIAALRAQTAARGKVLVERLASHPRYVRDAETWHSPRLATAVRHRADADGLARTDRWTPGAAVAPPALLPRGGIAAPAAVTASEATIIDRALAGTTLEEAEIVRLFAARGAMVRAIAQAADAMRRDRCGDAVTFVVNRNINYTNVCRFRCGFCAFSKGQKSDALRGRAYDVPVEEIVRRAVEARDRGATEVCLQGGIHPDYSGDTYLRIVEAIKRAVPEMHVHAFSPLEVFEGAREAGLSVAGFLAALKDRGLGTLPGTAAEILDDEVRRIICPDKLTTDLWLDIVATAHRTGLKTTATIMFGHADRPEHWARHLLRIRRLQQQTGGFTEFVPLPFIHAEAPMFLRGQARPGPTYREALLMHAVGRIVLYRAIDNIQVSWVKMGERGVIEALNAGVNDLGGTLMNESISRAAGTVHGQEWSPARMDRVIRSTGRTPRQRTTVYGTPDRTVTADAFAATGLADIVLPPAGKIAAIGSRRRKRLGTGAVRHVG